MYYSFLLGNLYDHSLVLKIIWTGRERVNLQEKIVLNGRERENLNEKMVFYQQTKTKLHNNLSPTALETVVKFSIPKPVITDNNIDEIVQHFCMNGARSQKTDKLSLI